MRTQDNSMNAWAAKRLSVFKKLKTAPTEWRLADLKDFNPRERVSKKGEIILDWLPIYAIPDGYKSPFKTDTNQSSKKCQLCDHDLVYHGVILHEATKQFLVVGDTCLVHYETDNDKKLKLELMVQLKDRYIFDKLNKEKEKLTLLVEENAKEIQLPYKFYTECVRKRYGTWGRAKFNNFLVKWNNALALVGYSPDLFLLGFNNHKKNLKGKILTVFGWNGAICHTHNTSFFSQEWKDAARAAEKDISNSLWTKCSEITKKVNGMNLIELRAWAKASDALREKYYKMAVIPNNSYYDKTLIHWPSYYKDDRVLEKKFSYYY